jgi:hypothetical protein
MSDYTSQLPVRSKQCPDECLWTKIVDATTTSQQAVVDAQGFVHVFTDGIYVALTNPTPASAGAIFHVRAASPAVSDQTFRSTGASPSSDAVDPANVHAIDVNSFGMYWDTDHWERVQGDAGAFNVNITNDSLVVDVDGVYNAVTNTDPDNVGLIGHTRNATPDDTHQVKRLTAITSDTVTALDVSLHDEDGNAYSNSNPLPVTFTDPAAGSTDVHEFNTSTDLAAGSSADFDYTVTALKTLFLKSWKVMSSSSAKGVLKIETGVGTDVFDSIDISYVSTADQNEFTPFQQPKEIAAGVKVRISVTNRDKQATDVHCFIEGYEI